MAGRHQRIDPFDRRDRRLLRQVRGGFRDGVHPRLQFRDDPLRRVAAAERLADMADIGPHIRQAERLAGNDLHRRAGPVAHCGLDVGQARAADLALVLGDDDIGTEVAQPVGVDAVDRQPVAHQVLDPGIDLAAAAAEFELRRGQDRQRLDARRVVAFVGPSDQVAAAAQGADDFGGAADQRDDAHDNGSLVMGRSASTVAGAGRTGKAVVRFRDDTGANRYICPPGVV